MDDAPALDALRHLVEAIVRDDGPTVSALLRADVALARARFATGGTRGEPLPGAWFIAAIGYQIYAGDTALHIAAAAYRAPMIAELVRAGADERARNRRGTEPLHAAAVGNPTAPRWDPQAQVATIAALVAAGADPNARNTDGAAPLHRAVRTRCADAVRALLEHGADPTLRNGSGSTPADLTEHTTGRGGSGTAEAKAQCEAIVRLLARGG